MRLLKFVILAALLIPSTGLTETPKTYVFEGPQDDSYATNSVIDIIMHDSAIWLVTGRGLNASYDNGLSWLLTNAGDGLVSENVSAAQSVGTRLWAGTSHLENIDGKNYSISDGVSWSDDNGQSWTQVDFSSTGQDIPFVWGGDQTIFDMTGVNSGPVGDSSWVFFTAFAGGLLASQDGGDSWRRIYPSIADSIQFNNLSAQPSLRNRYFSCVADTTHGDSLFVWSGTAGGVFQYVFVPFQDRFASNNAFALTACQAGDDSSRTFVFLGGENGVTRGNRLGGGFVTRSSDDGLDEDWITALFGMGNRLLVGMQESISGNAAGLAMSFDYGESYASVSFPGDGAIDAYIEGFALLGDRLFMAASSAGLLTSSDSGDTWARILYDSVDTDAAYNLANSVTTYGDSVLVGTDSGFVVMTVDGSGIITDRSHVPFDDNALFGARVVGMGIQEFESDTNVTLIDSIAYWTINRERELTGSPMVARSADPDDPSSWISYLFDTLSYDIDFIDDTAYVVGQAGVTGFYINVGSDIMVWGQYSVVDSLSTGRTLDDDTLYDIEIVGDTVFIGGSDGVAISADAAQNFRIYEGNTDSLRADLVVNHTYNNSAFLDTNTMDYVLGLTGDFLPALAVQPIQDGPARIWASCRSSGVGGDGISVGFYIPVLDTLGLDTLGYSIRWRALYAGDFAWNFAFYDDTIVYAATNAGLLMNHGDTSNVWDTMSFVDDNGLELLSSGSPVYGVEVLGDQLWVGTSEGTVRLNLLDETDMELFRVVDSTTAADEVYAFPVPFAPNRGGEVDFRFVVDQDANVTVEVYDFAMNQVARPIDNVFYPAGHYPNGGYPRVTWDGRNGDGEVVAVGVYYFRVEYSTGDVRWGKLAVIP